MSLLFQPTPQQKRTLCQNQRSPLQLGLEIVEPPPERGEGKLWQRRAHMKVLTWLHFHSTQNPLPTKTTPTRPHSNTDFKLVFFPYRLWRSMGHLIQALYFYSGSNLVLPPARVYYSYKGLPAKKRNPQLQTLYKPKQRKAIVGKGDQTCKQHSRYQMSFFFFSF